MDSHKNIPNNFSKIVQMGFCIIFQMGFCKIFQMYFQHFWLGPKGPTVGAEGCSSPQELEKAARMPAIFLVYFNVIVKYRL